MSEINKKVADKFEQEVFRLINFYTSIGLKKNDLVKKLEWILESSKKS